MLIDTHAHLAHGRLAGQTAEVLARATEAGVTGVICAASDLHESQAAATLAQQFEHLWRLAGIHPHEAKDANNETLRDIDDLVGLDDNCIAIGEIGLDYHYDFSPREDQQRIFAAQLELAKRRALPIVIHTREAFDDTMAILRDANVDGSRVIFHSFTGDAAAARAVLALGATLSFSGIATFKNAGEIREGVLLTPADRILVETDAPFLSPEPVRKMKTNEPANVVHVARRLAELRGETFESFAQQTTANARRIFSLPL